MAAAGAGFRWHTKINADNEMLGDFVAEVGGVQSPPRQCSEALGRRGPLSPSTRRGKSCASALPAAPCQSIGAGERVGGGEVHGTQGGWLCWHALADSGGTAAVVRPRACLTHSLIPAGGAGGGTAAGTLLCVWSVAPGARASARLVLCLKPGPRGIAGSRTAQCSMEKASSGTCHGSICCLFVQRPSVPQLGVRG